MSWATASECFIAAWYRFATGVDPSEVTATLALATNVGNKLRTRQG